MHPFKPIHNVLLLYNQFWLLPTFESTSCDIFHDSERKVRFPGKKTRLTFGMSSCVIAGVFPKNHLQRGEKSPGNPSPESTLQMAQQLD
jgi:hypothetical protein